jgi:hypothetical protein
LHQQHDAISPSRGSTFSRQGTQHDPEITSDKSSYITETEHLPPLTRPPATKLRHHLTNGNTHGFHFNNNQSPSTSAKKFITKTMSTTTTVKKAVKGGPVLANGTLSQSSRTTTSESHRKVKNG